MDNTNMFLDFEAIRVGQVLGTSVNFVTSSAIRDYAQAVEDLDPVYFDDAEAKRAGYPGIVAPAGFTLQYSAVKWATGQAGYVPQGSVHVRQEHALHGLIHEGDCLSTTVSVGDKYIKKGRCYLVHNIAITNQRGQTVCVSCFTNLLPEHVRQPLKEQTNGSTVTDQPC